MKTLKDIAAFIDQLPVSAFKDTYGHSAVISDALKRGYQRYEASNERKQDDEARERALDVRRNRDAALRADRERNVRAWLKNGTLVPGTFIKVTGARDGHGIREFISHDDRAVHCRQWLPVRFGRHEAVNPDALRRRGWLKIDGQWISPETQMTSHEYDKVVKVL